MSASDSEAELEIEEIIGERRTKSKKGAEYLVRWKGFETAAATWESVKNLLSAQGAIDDYHKRLLSMQKKKPRKSSTSRSRSRSRSRGRPASDSKSPARSRGRPRSSSKSPSRQKKSASPSRQSSRSRKSMTTSTPTRQEIKTETVVIQSPARIERRTETLARSAISPVDTERTATYSRTTEVRTSSLPQLPQVKTSVATAEEPSMVQRVIQCCCSPIQSLRQCCCSMGQCCGLSSDYPAIVVFATITVIMLSFVLEKHVDFEKVWAAIAGFFVAIWAWLTSLVNKKE